MEGVKVSRVVQVFLDEGTWRVEEVSVDRKSQAVSCTCPTFLQSRQCKHSHMVSARMEVNGGVYPMGVSLKDISREEIEASDASDVSYRQFVLKYGKIEAV